MAILKKLKGSTLMETLVASVLIVVIFMIASLILNNTFLNNIKNNTNKVDSRINELHYLELNDQLTLPYHETFDYWTISIDQFQENHISILEIEAINTDTNKTIIKQYFDTK